MLLSGDTVQSKLMTSVVEDEQFSDNWVVVERIGIDVKGTTSGVDSDL